MKTDLSEIFKKDQRDFIAKRIKELREEKEWSQQRMGDELNKRIGMESPKPSMVLDGDTGKQTVSQLERIQPAGKYRSMTTSLIVAYAEIFDVSADYILGMSDNRREEFKGVTETTGLSDLAVKVLTDINKNDKNSTLKLNVVSKLVEKGFVERFVNEIISLTSTSVAEEIISEKSTSVGEPLVEMSEIMKYRFSNFASEILTDVSKSLKTDYKDYFRQEIVEGVTKLNNKIENNAALELLNSILIVLGDRSSALDNLEIEENPDNEQNIINNFEQMKKVANKKR